MAFISIHAHQSQMVDRLGGYTKAMDESKLKTNFRAVDFYQAKKKTGRPDC
ncbi:hypothetical protein [Mucilaginibacter gossypiicola]|uniref:hypothetical protein n=1 Tax=Mucilaginibacter gossypiicola TaxID=551995 RepID=UPI001FCCBA8F|nr:hypothetical protein [Mucilaginibacter gossypiicola]